MEIKVIGAVVTGQTNVNDDVSVLNTAMVIKGNHRTEHPVWPSIAQHLETIHTFSFLRE